MVVVALRRGMCIALLGSLLTSWRFSGQREGSKSAILSSSNLKGRENGGKRLFSRLRGGKKWPMKDEDYDDCELYDGWMVKAELEWEAIERGEEPDIDKTLVAERQQEIEDEIVRKVEAEKEALRLSKIEEADSNWGTMPEDYQKPFDWDHDADLRPFYMPHEVPQDEDGWTYDMWYAFEQGLRKFGPQWRQILNTPRSRRYLRFMDQSDLIIKWRKEKAKNKTWGVYPNFYYFHGKKGQKPKSEKKADHNYHLHRVPGATRYSKLVFNRTAIAEKRANPPPSGYHGVYYNVRMGGWIGEYKYWKGGSRSTGRVTRECTPAYDLPKDAYDHMMRLKEARGVVAGEQFEDALIRIGIDPRRVAGKPRVRLHDFMHKQGLLNRTVPEELLLTPAPIRIGKWTLYKYYGRDQIHLSPRKDYSRPGIETPEYMARRLWPQYMKNRTVPTREGTAIDDQLNRNLCL